MSQDVNSDQLSEALVGVEVANARVIELTKRLVDLVKESRSLKAEIEEGLKHQLAGNGATERSHADPSLPRASKRNVFRSIFRRRLSVRAVVCLDKVCNITWVRGAEISLIGRANVSFEGWMVPASGEKAFEGMVLTLQGNGTSVTAQAMILIRKDVAVHLKKPGMEKSGFYCEIPTSRLTPSEYDMIFVGTDGAGIQHREIFGSIKFI